VIRGASRATSLTKGKQVELDVVGGDEPELPFARRGIESDRRREDAIEMGHGEAHGLDQGSAALGQHQPAPRGNEKGIAEVRAQASQRVAHRGLGEADGLGGPGDVLLGEQGVQGDEEVRVDRGEVHSTAPLRLTMAAVDGTDATKP
jgi:hypothetical protein